jgi:hypothetical protein
VVGPNLDALCGDEPAASHLTSRAIIARDPVSLTVPVHEPSKYVVRVRWSRYLTALRRLHATSRKRVVDGRG